MSDNSRQKEDPLLRKVRRAEEQANRAREEAKNGADDSRPGFVSKLGEIFRAAERFNKMYDNVVDVMRSVKKYTGPVGRFVGWGFKKAGEGLKWAAFERENGDFKRDEDGDLIFSKGRLAKTFAGVAGAAVATHIALSAAYFYATQFEELVYTTGKQEISTGDLYQFTGCTSLPCSTEAENGKFYEIERSLYFPYLPYPEEDVYANIPQQDGACYAKGYGMYFKQLKILHRQLEWYQKVYDISCRPYTDAEKQQAIEGQAIPVPKEILPSEPVSKPAPVPKLR